MTSNWLSWHGDKSVERFQESPLSPSLSSVIRALSLEKVLQGVPACKLSLSKELVAFLIFICTSGQLVSPERPTVSHGNKQLNLPREFK